MEHIRINIPASSAPDRLDRLIARYYSRLSRREIKRLIVRGAVYVNRRRIRQASYQIFPPAVIQIFIKNNLQIEHIAEQIHWPSRILFHDAHLIVVDKPAGIPTAPTRDSVVHNVYSYLQQAGILQRHFYPFHRLDAETSGVLIIPLSRRAVRSLNEQLRRREIQKTYLALCQGAPPSPQWTVSGSISRQRTHPSRYTFSPGEHSSRNFSQTLFLRVAQRTQPEISVILARPITGKTHQIRLHLQYSGLPILGDFRYGFSSAELPGEISSPERTLLHCREMVFVHPITLDRLKIQAPLPADFSRFLRLLFPDISDNINTNLMPTP